MRDNESKNVQLVADIYAAFGRGDIAFVLNALAEDVEWHFPGPEGIPLAGNRRGRQQVAQFFTVIGETLDVEAFGVEEIIAQEEKVIALGHERMRCKTTGRTYETCWAHVFTLRDGKIASFREYTDTAAIAHAYSLQ
ncbi:MAG TPA: nuclear transport factor 2 family protein [Chthonomonadales bacterium]|nr:nuclear transport factor 2 family protein [Chthonomonadales bacterium]